MPYFLNTSGSNAVVLAEVQTAIPALLSSSKSAFHAFFKPALYASNGFTLPIQVPTPCGTAATLTTFAFIDFAVFTFTMWPLSSWSQIRTFRIVAGIGAGTASPASVLMQDAEPAISVTTLHRNIIAAF